MRKSKGEFIKRFVQYIVLCYLVNLLTGKDNGSVNVLLQSISNINISFLDSEVPHHHLLPQAARVFRGSPVISIHPSASRRHSTVNL